MLDNSGESGRIIRGVHPIHISIFFLQTSPKIVLINSKTIYHKIYKKTGKNTFTLGEFTINL